MLQVTQRRDCGGRAHAFLHDQPAHRGQPVAGLELAGLEQFRQLVGELKIDRPVGFRHHGVHSQQNLATAGRIDSASIQHSHVIL
jgi:hypothetical protein